MAAIFLFFLIFLIFLILVLISLWNYATKLEAYECGLKAMGDARSQFSIIFFIIALLYQLFDIEILLLLPFAVTFLIKVIALLILLAFIFILTLGQLYEFLSLYGYLYSNGAILHI